MSPKMRAVHRWTSIVFMLTVIINTVAAILQVQSVAIGLMALAPLIVLMVTGMYMFFRPYFVKARTA